MKKKARKLKANPDPRGPNVMLSELFADLQEVDLRFAPVGARLLSLLRGPVGYWMDVGRAARFHDEVEHSLDDFAGEGALESTSFHGIIPGEEAFECKTWVIDLEEDDDAFNLAVAWDRLGVSDIDLICNVGTNSTLESLVYDYAGRWPDTALYRFCRVLNQTEMVMVLRGASREKWVIGCDLPDHPLALQT